MKVVLSSGGFAQYSKQNKNLKPKQKKVNGYLGGERELLIDLWDGY